jgi:hypothetical protein
MRAPVILFRLSGGGQDWPPFSVSASDLAPLARRVIPADRYAALADGLAGALGEPADDADAARLADLVLLTLCQHPIHGDDFRDRFADAMRAFPVIVIALVITDGQIGFSLGSSGDLLDLRCRLAELDGPTATGVIGPWPVAPPPH